MMRFTNSSLRAGNEVDQGGASSTDAPPSADGLATLAVATSASCKTSRRSSFSFVSPAACAAMRHRKKLRTGWSLTARRTTSDGVPGFESGRAVVETPAWVEIMILSGYVVHNPLSMRFERGATVV
jgi:hypothetical protein